VRDLSRPRGEHGDSQRALLDLKLAFDAEAGWLERLEQGSEPGALAAFLREVAGVVPFYRDRLGARPAHELALSAFPIVSRADYLEDPRQFLIPPLESEIRSITPTNGTIGAPLAVTFDPVAWFDLNYGIYAMAGAVYPDLLDRMVPRAEGIFLVNNNPWVADESTYVPPLNLAVLRQLPLGRSADEDASLVAYLRSVPVPLLYGKASNLTMLAAADAELGRGAGADRIRPGAILVSGEALYDDQRVWLERWFDCAVINAYLSTEGGLAAIECPHRTTAATCSSATGSATRSS
jgi:phenylacetate-coenzyme A ligase PaaK-like adenylate-forming protein